MTASMTFFKRESSFFLVNCRVNDSFKKLSFWIIYLCHLYIGTLKIIDSEDNTTRHDSLKIIVINNQHFIFCKHCLSVVHVH